MLKRKQLLFKLCLAVEEDVKRNGRFKTRNLGLYLISLTQSSLTVVRFYALGGESW